MVNRERLAKRRLLVSASIIAASVAAFASPSFAQNANNAQQPETVVVVGTRASIQSSINRKRNSGTISDSIVAEDVGKFPDKNVGEALSRVTGVQLSRDFGEGVQVSIRGVEPDLNRIEINGMTVLGTSGAGARGADLRELPSELIQSIDVFKGFTADMVEGGVGGTVSIKTRRPLDFRKPAFALTLSEQYLTTDGNLQPRFSMLATRKFFDDRLGLMANITYDNIITRNDYARNTAWNFLRDWDFAADKTVVSRNATAAAVTSAAGCAALTVTADRNACNAQWFDYAPRIARYGIWTRDHTRISGDFTADYKLTEKSRVWASYQANTQHQILNDRNFGTDLTAVTRLASQGALPTYNATTGVPTGGSCVAASATATPAGMTVVNHHVTKYTVGNCLSLAGQGAQGAFSTAARDFILDIDTKYLSGGYIFKGDKFKAEFMASHSESMWFGNTNNVVFTQNAPGMTVELDSVGVPKFNFPTGSSPEDPNSYVAVQLQYRPQENEIYEDSAKADFEYKFEDSFVDKVMFGGRWSKNNSILYTGGGRLVSGGTLLNSTADDINLIGANINLTMTFDPLNTTNVLRANDVQTFINSNFVGSYVSRAMLSQIVASSGTRSPGVFFKGYDGVSGLPQTWFAPIWNQAARYFDTSKFNHDNVRDALGSDGKTYAQIPGHDVGEETFAGYVRADFKGEFLGREYAANIGARYVKTKTQATGLNSLQERMPTVCQGALPVGQTRDQCITLNAGLTHSNVVLLNDIVTINKEYDDFLPAVNLAYWAIPNKFAARFGYAKVISRPRMSDLAPNVTCVIGSGSRGLAAGTTAEEDDCTGGNPNLKPYRASEYDLSFEYYPNRDTQVSVGLFRKDIDTFVVGRAVRTVDFFGTGTMFDVNQPINGEGAITEGVEATFRTAFTMLPGWLSGFGTDLNYTYLTAKNVTLENVLDGTLLPYPGMSENSYNVTLWYDKGPINARVAYNFRDPYYTGGNDVTGNPVFKQETGYLDAKITWKVSKTTSVFFEAKNLTDQAEVANAGDPFRMTEIAWPGRRYFAGVSIKY